MSQFILKEKSWGMKINSILQKILAPIKENSIFFPQIYIACKQLKIFVTIVQV